MPRNTTTFPSEAKARKSIPVATGCVDYFPDALAAVAELSRIGNDQHNPGQPLHWDRSKSTDEANALMRHFVERGTVDGDGVRHSVKVAWRALALLQKELEGVKSAVQSMREGAIGGITEIECLPGESLSTAAERALLDRKNTWARVAKEDDRRFVVGDTVNLRRSAVGQYPGVIVSVLPGERALVHWGLTAVYALKDLRHGP